MPVTVGVDGLSVVHAGSGGITLAFPDVCRTPMGPAVVPVPYPNLARSADAVQGARTVTCDGHPLCLDDSHFSVSTGDEGGSLLGVASSTIRGRASFVSGSLAVQAEGRQVVRAFDLMLHNDRNTPPFPVVQAPLPGIVACGGGQRFDGRHLRIPPRRFNAVLAEVAGNECPEDPDGCAQAIRAGLHQAAERNPPPRPAMEERVWDRAQDARLREVLTAAARACRQGAWAHADVAHEQLVRIGRMLPVGNADPSDRPWTGTGTGAGTER